MNVRNGGDTNGRRRRGPSSATKAAMRYHARQQGYEEDVPGCVDVLDLPYNHMHDPLHDACCDRHRDSPV